MYLLISLTPRAETTDTVVYYAAYEKEILEEVLLSIYNDAMRVEEQYNISHSVVKEYLNRFQILEVPVLT